MKFLIVAVAFLAVVYAEEKKQEKRGVLGLGYGAAPLSLGHGISYGAPAISYAAPALSYAAPSISYGSSYDLGLGHDSYLGYSAPLLAKSYAAPIAAPIAAPLLTKAYAAPIAAPLLTKTYAAPIAAPILAKSYSAPIITKTYASAPLALDHGLAYSSLGYGGYGLGYGKLLH